MLQEAGCNGLQQVGCRRQQYHWFVDGIMDDEVTAKKSLSILKVRGVDLISPASAFRKYDQVLA